MSSSDKAQARKTKTKRKTKATAKKMTMMTTRTTATQSEPALFISVGDKREHFVKVVEDALDSLPQEFRSRIGNVAVLVEDMPPNQPSSQSGQQERLLRVPTTKKSILT